MCKQEFAYPENNYQVLLQAFAKDVLGERAGKIDVLTDYEARHTISIRIQVNMHLHL